VSDKAAKSLEPKQGKWFDAAPFAELLESKDGLIWEDPRRIQCVVAVLADSPPQGLQLQYWRKSWPEQHLPDDQIPSGGDTGWWEMDDWYSGQWQTADAEATIDGKTVTFRFQPINENEFPELDDFAVDYRVTLKLRLTAPAAEVDIRQIHAYTTSIWDQRSVAVVFEQPSKSPPTLEVFNGILKDVTASGNGRHIVELWCTKNSDLNTFDETLLTIYGPRTVTVVVDDATADPVWIPDAGLCVAPDSDQRDYHEISAALAISCPNDVYDAVRGLPEQTWSRAWRKMVPKKGCLPLPLAADGSRHKFRVDTNGSIAYRTNNSLLTKCPGVDTDRLVDDAEHLRLGFELPEEPTKRTIQDGILPIGITHWQLQGVEVEQVVFATPLDGTDPQGLAPPADACGVLMARFRFENTTESSVHVQLPFFCRASDEPEQLRFYDGLIWSGDNLRASVEPDRSGEIAEAGGLTYTVELLAGETCQLLLKVPYIALNNREIEQLRNLDFDSQRKAVAEYWRRKLDQGMRLTTPESMLNEFHRAHLAHLLINCEKEPGSDRRFARVGSFGYTAYGNESCMMIVDLDRRGYHQHARECLEAFIEYQGTVPLPGNFSSHDGVLYGACGYEHGGYNQHHGWILWTLVEHFRFTRDQGWLRQIAPNIVAACEWIIHERARSEDRFEVGKGLLPAGSLEDVSNWWHWLSTNAYSWRGLDAAAWALERIAHPQAERIRKEADDYHKAIIDSFTRAAERSPVVRLRNGHWVPHFPSHVHRRGRSWGWIRETLEGAIHLLIAGVLPADGPEAEWIVRDLEDNLHLSPYYGYEVEDYENRWFDWGGFSMQACLLLDVEPYLYRDDVKHALRACFNAIAANYLPDTRMLVEHALPKLGDLRGDYYKTSDEANAAGWLRYLFVREEGDELLIGQAIPMKWLSSGNHIGVENAATHFGPMSVTYEMAPEQIIVMLDAPRRNPPETIRIRLRVPQYSRIHSVEVAGAPTYSWQDDWVKLPGNVERVRIVAML